MSRDLCPPFCQEQANYIIQNVLSAQSFSMSSQLNSFIGVGLIPPNHRTSHQFHTKKSLKKTHSIEFDCCK